MNDMQWVYPVLVAAALAAFGWLLRNAWSGIAGKIDSLESAFTRVTADLAADHKENERRLDDHDRRLTRVESWKELVSLPDTRGRQRRISDRLQAQHLAEEESDGNS